MTPLTPYGIWLAVVTVCSLSYLSYLLQRYAPIKDVTLLPAVLGGAYSSTATTVVPAKRLREAKQARSGYFRRHRCGHGGHVCAARRSDRCFQHPDFALTLAPALTALCAIGAALAVYEWRRPRARTAKTQSRRPAEEPAANPDRASFRRAHRRGLGDFGLGARRVRRKRHSRTVGGGWLCHDILPFVLNIAQGAIAGMSIAKLCAAVLIATSSNNVAKAAYTVGFGGMTAARRPALMLLAGAVRGGGGGRRDLYLFTLSARDAQTRTPRRAGFSRGKPEPKQYTPVIDIFTTSASYLGQHIFTTSAQPYRIRRNPARKRRKARKLSASRAERRAYQSLCKMTFFTIG